LVLAVLAWWCHLILIADDFLTPLLYIVVSCFLFLLLIVIIYEK
jgi:hypothetical protein